MQPDMLLAEKNSMEKHQIPVSAFIVCRDEKDCIAACLESVAFCRDIVVVDSGSTDGTLDIIRDFRDRGYPVRLFERSWPGYAAQKQFAFDQCREEWCLNLDADERVDAGLAAAIARAVAASDPGCDAFRLGLREWLAGYGFAPRGVAHQQILRLARRSRAHYSEDRVIHESLIVPGRVRTLSGGWIWHRHAASLEELLAKQNSYTTLKAEELLRRGRQPRPWKLVTRPLGYFLKFYVLKRYFLCGRAGFVHAALSAQYAFQSEAKLWLGTAEPAKSSREIAMPPR